jgi:hypothetical protein
LRLRTSLQHYPAVVLIFSVVAALVFLVKGHAILLLIRNIVPSSVSDAKLISVAIVVIVLTTGAVLAYFLRQQYKECDCQECLYCQQCDAVDKYDSGTCPVCLSPLTNKESFYYTSFKDEQKVLERWGLRPTREG